MPQLWRCHGSLTLHLSESVFNLVYLLVEAGNKFSYKKVGGV